MYVPSTGLILSQPLYDTIELSTTAGIEGSFFNVPYGGVLNATTNKGWNHTNLIQAGRLDTGYEFVMKGISFHFPEQRPAPAEVDIRAIQYGWLRFDLSDTNLLTVPLSAIPNGGNELVLFSNITPAATEFQLNNGHSVHQNRFIIEESGYITISPQQSIKAVIGGFHYTLGATTQVTLMLWGTLTRPVVG